MPNTSFVFASLTLSSLILHHRSFFRLRLPRTISLTLVRTAAIVAPLLGICGIGEELGDTFLPFTFDSVERADRAIERMLPVSESWGAEVGPLAVAPVEADSDIERDSVRSLPFLTVSPEGLPLVYGSERDDGAAEAGERSSGVEERVLVSADSSDLCNASTCGVEIREGTGVGGLLYTGAGWKVLTFEKGCATL